MEQDLDDRLIDAGNEGGERAATSSPTSSSELQPILARIEIVKMHVDKPSFQIVSCHSV